MQCNRIHGMIAHRQIVFHRCLLWYKGPWVSFCFLLRFYRDDCLVVKQAAVCERLSLRSLWARAVKLAPELPFLAGCNDGLWWGWPWKLERLWLASAADISWFPCCYDPWVSRCTFQEWDGPRTFRAQYHRCLDLAMPWMRLFWMHLERLKLELQKVWRHGLLQN